MSVLQRVTISPDQPADIASYRKIEPRVALILGTGDIASAIARDIFLAGWAVVMLRDPGTPVLRRGMAFDDALEGENAEIDGVAALKASEPAALANLALRRDGVVLANLDLTVVAMTCPGLATALIDARMRKYATPPDLRLLAACAIGIGPGFIAGTNVHVAIETLPGREGGLIHSGATAVPTGEAVPLGGAGSERFVYAPAAGPWHPAVALGTDIAEGATIGSIAGQPIHAPISGCIRGMVRPTPGGIARGMKLAEIDPRPGAPWQGVAPRPARIASGVTSALSTVLAPCR